MTHMLLSSAARVLVYLLIYKIARPFGIPATIVFVIGGIAASVLVARLLQRRRRVRHRY
jgi:hypothetical protein